MQCTECKGDGLVNNMHNLCPSCNGTGFISEQTTMDENNTANESVAAAAEAEVAVPEVADAAAPAEGSAEAVAE